MVRPLPLRLKLRINKLKQLQSALALINNQKWLPPKLRTQRLINKPHQNNRKPKPPRKRRLRLKQLPPLLHSPKKRKRPRLPLQLLPQQRLKPQRLLHQQFPPKSLLPKKSLHKLPLRSLVRRKSRKTLSLRARKNGRSMLSLSEMKVLLLSKLPDFKETITQR